MQTERSLKIAITKAKNALKNSTGTLEDKILLKISVSEKENELHQFKLNYFDREATK